MSDDRRGLTGAGWLAPVIAVARRIGRDRWRANVVVGVLVAVTVAMAVATLTGARRAETAFDRLRVDSHSSDIRFFFEDADLAASLDALAEVEGISEIGVSSEMFVRPVGSELFPDYQLLPIAARPDLGGDLLDIPRIVAGRAVRPDAVDEIALSEGLASDLEIDVGDTIELESMSVEWIDVAFNGGDPGPPDGPVVSVEVVGLARTPADFGRWLGVIHLSPAFATRFEDQVRTYTWVSARVTDTSEAGLNALREGPLDAFEVQEVDRSFFTDSDATTDGLNTIAVSLRLVALAAILAGVTAVGLALVRLARDTLAVRVTLAAIGWTRAQLVALVVLLLLPWVLSGVVVGLVLGAVGSPLAVVGLARAVDPDVGALAPYPGWIAVVGAVSVLVSCVLLGLTAMRAARRTAGSTAPGRALPRLSHPLAVPIGVRRALFGASDRGGRASRGAAVAVAVSVVVAVAALLVGASIQRLQDDPTLSGPGRLDQRFIDSGEATDVFDRAMALLDGDDRVSDLAGIHIAFGISAPGTGELTALVLDVRRGDVGAAIVSGRFAVQPDEVAVGPATLEELGRSIGDDVELSSEQGTARFRIVGTTLFPEGDFSHDSGLALTADGAERFLGDVEVDTALHQVVFSWADGVDAAAADRSLEDEGFPPLTGAEGLRPAVVSNLAEVRDLPRVLAALVIALGLVTLLHAVSLTTRAREQEAGTLRALGVSPRSVSLVVEIQGLVLALVAVGAGIPLGLALGRQIWSPIAQRAHVVDRPIPSWGGTVWLVAAVLIGASVVALPLALRSLRHRPAAALRAE